MPLTGGVVRLHPSELYLEVRGFPGVPGWTAGFTTRSADGSLERILPHLGWEGIPVFRPKQTHGARVLVIEESTEPGASREADGLATKRRGALIAVAGADCVPLLLFDPRRRAGAVLHAGWRGTRSAIALEGVRVLRETWRCRPSDLLAVLGPCIGSCCYRVGEEVLQAFADAGLALEGLARREGDRIFLDLPAANRRILTTAGLDPGRIFGVDLCTRCREDLFPSYRRDGPAAGRLLGFLGSAREP